MATYKLIGRRHLRKYTADRLSPSYAASADAQRIVDELCEVPWKRVAEKEASMTFHTEENVGTKEEPVTGLDMNVRIRNQFDAALFCAEHSGSLHRAYANAAVYHYVLPSGTLPKLTRLTVQVTSDPYNSAGARIAVLTNSTGDIPTNCYTCRTGDSHADGVAPRTVGANGNWFPTVADCVFSADAAEGETALPSGGLQLHRHLFVFVLMESYSTVRGNWLEGCSFIRNLVRIETDAAVPGWSDGETIDASATGEPGFLIARNGVLPCAVSACVGSRHVSVRTDANRLVEDNGDQSPIRAAAGDSAASALGRLYAMFYGGGGELPAAAEPTVPAGAAFNVLRTVEQHVRKDSDRPVDTEILRIDSAALCVPFAFPGDMVAARLVLSFAAMPATPGSRFNVLLVEDYLLSLSEEQLKTPGLYDGGKAPFAWLGTIDHIALAAGGTVLIDLPPISSRVGTVVITGFLPPEAYDFSQGGLQGTGPTAFMPDVSITE